MCLPACHTSCLAAVLTVLQSVFCQSKSLFWLSDSLTVWLSVSLLSSYLPVCLSLSACLSGFKCQSACLTLCQPVCLDFCQFACLALYACQSASLASLSVCLSTVILSVCHFVSLFVILPVCYFVSIYAFVDLLTSNMYSSLSESVYILSLLLYLYVCLFFYFCRVS
jgi:hypothetical protein